MILQRITVIVGASLLWLYGEQNQKSISYYSYNKPIHVGLFNPQTIDVACVRTYVMQEFLRTIST